MTDRKEDKGTTQGGTQSKSADKARETIGKAHTDPKGKKSGSDSDEDMEREGRRSSSSDHKPTASSQSKSSGTPQDRKSEEHHNSDHGGKGHKTDQQSRH